MKAKDSVTGRVYIVAESRLKDIPGAVPKPKKAKKGAGEAPHEGGWEVIMRSPCLEMLWVKGNALAFQGVIM